jgi:NADPH2:quinone reductase
MMSYRVRLYEYGGPEKLCYEVDPDADDEPGAGKVRIRHDAIGLNYVDTLFRSGEIPFKIPANMGVEGAGVVEAVGSGVNDLKVGDSVAYFFSFGAYAGVRLVDAALLVKLPGNVSTNVAAALMAKGLTAWMMLKCVHEVRQGDVVLVNGAAGGVGSLTATWASSLGATVIAVVGSPSKASSLRDRGIKHVFNQSDPEFNDKLQSLTHGRGVDVAYELVGRVTFKQTAQALRENGHMVHVGNASGAPTADEIAAIAGRSIRYSRPHTNQYVTDRQSLEKGSTDLFAAYSAGVFGPIEPVQYPLAAVTRAHEDLKARRILGPAVLIP